MPADSKESGGSKTYDLSFVLVLQLLVNLAQTHGALGETAAEVVFGRSGCHTHD